MENKSIGVFIDGGYYAKINEGFDNTRKVNLKGLLSFITGICALSGPKMVGGDFQTINPMIVSFANSTTSRDLAAVLAMLLGLATVFLIFILNKLESKGNFISVSTIRIMISDQHTIKAFFF